MDHIVSQVCMDQVCNRDQNVSQICRDQFCNGDHDVSQVCMDHDVSRRDRDAFHVYKDYAWSRDPVDANCMNQASNKDRVCSWDHCDSKCRDRVGSRDHVEGVLCLKYTEQSEISILKLKM